MRMDITRQPGDTNIIIGSGLPPCTPVRIYHPHGFTETVLAGSKEEHGPGGFEVLSVPGEYRLDALGQRFDFTVAPGTTRLTFTDNGDPEDPPRPPPDDPTFWQLLGELGEAIDAAALSLEHAHDLYLKLGEYLVPHQKEQDP